MTRYYGYLGNPNLPRADYVHSYTQKEHDEFVKCSQDPVYFARNYIKIINVDKGLVPFDMWSFQEEMIRNYHENRFTICMCPRQVGKSTTSIAYLLHYILFNPNVNVAMLANKASTSRELLGRLKLAYEYLPTFLKMGVVEWAKGFIQLSNGSKIIAESTSASTIRGFSFNIVFLDEFAHVPNNLAEEFFMSTYPTITSGHTTKVIIVSTPNGMNLFYKMWTAADEGKSDYVPFSIHWSDVPGRDDQWKEMTIRNTSERQFEQEFECHFLGGANALINPAKLRQLAIKTPLETDGHLDIFEHPQKKHTYALCVDVAEGQGLDYSTFSIIDVTSIPYTQVAKYRNNEIAPLLFPTVIYSAAKRYNDAFVLVEINSIGLQVADILHYELGYENLLKFQLKGKQGNQVSGGFGAGKNKIAFGLKTTIQTKNIGCSNLKALVESDKLIINDIDTISELSTFSADHKTFKAEEGTNDDLAMTLVSFGWLTAQRVFKEHLNNDIRKTLQEEQLALLDSQIVPFGIIDDGLKEDVDVDSKGDVWTRHPYYDQYWDFSL